MTFDDVKTRFEIEYLAIERQVAAIKLGNDSLYFRSSPLTPDRFQVYLQTGSGAEKTMLFYTGKTTGIADKDLLVGDIFIIHCTSYSYEDANHTATTGIASYKDAYEMAQLIDPAAMFLVHYSSRYANPMEEIDKGRVRKNVIKTNDGYRFDFATSRDKDTR